MILLYVKLNSVSFVKGVFTRNWFWVYIEKTIRRQDIPYFLPRCVAFVFPYTLPEVQLSIVIQLIQIQFGYIQLILSGNWVSNRNYKNCDIEPEKGRIQFAGFTPFCWYIICVSHGF